MKGGAKLVLCQFLYCDLTITAGKAILKVPPEHCFCFLVVVLTVRSSQTKDQLPNMVAVVYSHQNANVFLRINLMNNTVFMFCVILFKAFI